MNILNTFSVRPSFSIFSSPPAFFLLVAITMSSCSTTREIQKIADKHFETSEAFRQGFSGLMVYDPATGKVVYEYNSDKYFTPASNTKLFTYYAGLKMLGDSVPALEYTIENDSLIFQGTGDPSFLYSDLPPSKIFNFLAESEKQLFFLPAVEVEPHFGPGWAWNWYNASYAVERADFPIYGNRVHFSFTEMVAQTKPAFFQDSLVVEEDSSFQFSSIRRDVTKNKFTYSTSGRSRDREQNIPFKYSPQLLVELLSDTLQKEVKIFERTAGNLVLEKTLYSVPADSLYKRMLVVSDNFIAEQILLLAANKLSDTLKTRIAIDYMKENHLNDLPDEPIWHDGSGLAPINKFTPRSIVKLLEKIQEEVPQEKLLDMLATGGVSGTLRNDYKAEEPFIFAKTGTLRNVHALSGFLKTKTGKILIFSFMNNNYVVPTSEIKSGMENILRTVRDNY